MASSSRTIEGIVSLTRLTNRALTPDRSAAVAQAEREFEEAKKAHRNAKDPDRAALAVDTAKEALDIAIERLAKAESVFAIAQANLNATKSATLSPAELQLLVDEVDTATTREKRAAAKIDRLKESVKLCESTLKRAQSLSKPPAEITEAETKLEAEQQKLANASIQFRKREAELKVATSKLKDAQRSSKSPEELKLLEDRLTELQGNVTRAKSRVTTLTTDYQTAQQTAKQTADDYLKLEAAFAASKFAYEQISDRTEQEKRFELIESKIGQVAQFADMGADIRNAIAMLPDAESWWNGLCLASAGLAALVYFTPLASVLQTVTKATNWTLSGAKAVKQSFDSTWSPDLQESPKVDETIAGWIVTSAYGPRTAPCPGCSDRHGGVDLASPDGPQKTIGRQLYSIGKPGTKAQLTCWWDDGGGGLVASLKPQSMPGITFDYLHLSKCALNKGETREIEVGPVIAAVGGSGSGTSPHAHLQKSVNGKRVPISRGEVWWILTGDRPEPVVAQSRLKD